LIGLVDSGKFVCCISIEKEEEDAVRQQDFESA